MKKGVSIVLCTYNGKDKLDDTLSHIVSQKCTIPCEIIFVDNASTDQTKQFADNWWKENGCNNIDYHSFEQPIPGKSYAQDLGYEKANYEYLLVCDDDNWLAPDYIQISYDIMESHNNIGALGGWCEAEFEKEKPDWFDELSGFYAVSKQGDTSGDITNKKGCLFGAGMVIRKSHWIQLKKLGFVPLLSCRKGNSLSSGGDTEYSYALRLLGYRIWYDERLYFKHYMANNRMNLKYLSRLRKGMSEANKTLQPYRDLLKNKEINKKAYKERIFRQIKTKWKRNLYNIVLGSFKDREDAKDFFRMVKDNIFGFDDYVELKSGILKWLPTK